MGKFRKGSKSVQQRSKVVSKGETGPGPDTGFRDWPYSNLLVVMFQVSRRFYELSCEKLNYVLKAVSDPPSRIF